MAEQREAGKRTEIVIDITGIIEDIEEEVNKEVKVRIHDYLFHVDTWSNIEGIMGSRIRNGIRKAIKRMEVADKGVLERQISSIIKKVMPAVIEKKVVSLINSKIRKISIEDLIPTKSIMKGIMASLPKEKK